MSEEIIISLDEYRFLPNQNLVLRLWDPQVKVTYHAQLAPSEIKALGRVIPVIRIRYWYTEDEIVKLRTLLDPKNKISGAIVADDKLAVAQHVMALIQKDL